MIQRGLVLLAEHLRSADRGQDVDVTCQPMVVGVGERFEHMGEVVVRGRGVPGHGVGQSQLAVGRGDLRLLMSVAAATLCGVMSPAFAAPATTATPADHSGLGVVEKLSAAEVKAFEQRSPEKAARLEADSVRRHGGVAAQGTWVKIHNKASGKCLAIGSSSQANGAHAIQWDCIDSDAQTWWIDGHFVANAASGEYLAIGSSSTANGAHAIQWEYTGSQGQQWTWSGEFFWNNNSVKYLAIGDSGTANGAHALQWAYTGSNGQRWY